MITIAVFIFVKDRYKLTKLCSDFLLKSQDVANFKFKFIAIDDSSEDDKVKKYINETYSYNKQFSSTCSDPVQRIGMLRHFACNLFTYENDSDYLLLLDNDILVTKATIVEAINDYILLDTYNIGGYTLKGFSHFLNDVIIIENKKFQSLSLTGDAHMLFSRKHLKVVGNNFSAKEGGFADNQISMIYEKGLRYYTRIIPHYQVQHLGFGQKASLCNQSDIFKPWWTMRPYWTFIEPKQIVPVENFDVYRFANIANEFGPEKAADIFLKNINLTL
jgi:hypothetical protein